jgi:hypothetical protein
MALDVDIVRNRGKKTDHTQYSSRGTSAIEKESPVLSPSALWLCYYVLNRQPLSFGYFIFPYI